MVRMPERFRVIFSFSRSRTLRCFLAVFLDLARGPEHLQFFEAIEAGTNRFEIGECSAEPPLVHVGHSHACGLLSDAVAGLPLGADDENIVALRHNGRHELLRAKQTFDGLADVDDVNGIPLPKDELRHLRIPSIGSMAEMDAGINETADQLR